MHTTTTRSRILNTYGHVNTVTATSSVRACVCEVCVSVRVRELITSRTPMHGRAMYVTVGL